MVARSALVETCERNSFLFPGKCTITRSRTWLAVNVQRGQMMGMEERIVALEKENRKLRDDNEKLMKTIDQMRKTLNRLLDHGILRTET